MRRDPSLHGLSHQHQHGLGLCVVIRRALDQGASPAQRLELAAKVEAIWESELEAHFSVEELILFPSLKGRIDEPLLVDRLIQEHREIETRIDDLRADPQELRLRAFAQLLTDHIRAEERELFQQAQEHLSPEELAELGRRLEAKLAQVCPAASSDPT